MPACLHQSKEIRDKNVQAMGWGATSFGGQSSDELLKGFLSIVENSECQKHYSEDTDELRDGVISSQLCAGDSTRTRDTW